MGSIVKLIADTLGYVLSFVCPPNIFSLFRALLSHVYTGFLRKRFGTFGKGALIAYKAQNLHGLNTIFIGERTKISQGAQLTTWESADGKQGIIRIGQNCNIRDDVHITSVRNIKIGNNLLTGTNVLITDNSHGKTDYHNMCIAPDEREIVSKGSVTIGDNVWIGNNVCIMPGVKVGDGVIIGANSIVTKDIPNYCVAAGIPAKIIRINKDVFHET